MEITKIKYNQKLFDTQHRLNNEIEFINKEIAQTQKECNHVVVNLGYSGTYPSRDNSYNECLFCGKENPDCKLGRYIEAYTYKSQKYYEGFTQIYRQKIKEELLKLWIDIQENNENYSEEDIIEEIKKQISLEEAKKLEKKIYK